MLFRRVAVRASALARTVEQRFISSGSREAEQLHAHEGEAEMLRVRLLHPDWWQRGQFDRRAGIDRNRLQVDFRIRIELERLHIDRRIGIELERLDLQVNRLDLEIQTGRTA